LLFRGWQYSHQKTRIHGNFKIPAICANFLKLLKPFI
jgi:hypothetical protein